MRISEFCGLTVKDIDFENHLINVDHQLIRTPDMALHVQATKTNAGKRHLGLEDAAEEMKRLEEVERARLEQDKLNQNRDDDEAGTVVAM